MKITHRQLRQIIQEELSRLNESESPYKVTFTDANGREGEVPCNQTGWGPGQGASKEDFERWARSFETYMNGAGKSDVIDPTNRHGGPWNAPVTNVQVVACS